jgi:hypothetical protein
MTLEEAGELILANEPWNPCPDCNGKGYVPKRTLTKDDIGASVNLDDTGTLVATTDCLSCKAKGHFLKSEYREAYALVGQAEPKTPREIDDEAWAGAMEDVVRAAHLPVGILMGVGPDKQTLGIQVTGNGSVTFKNGK